MQIKLDQNLPEGLSRALAERGHDVLSVLDQNLAGAQDAALREVYQAEGRVPITLDLDFADILTYPPSEAPGIIVLRCPVQSRRQVTNLALFALDALENEDIRGKICVAEPGRTRIRGG